MTLQWASVFVGGLAVGMSIVGLLALRRKREPLALLLGIAGVIVGTWGIVEIIDLYAETRTAVGVIGLSMASLGGGYALASSLLPYFKIKRSTPSLPDHIASTTDRWGVLLLACIEPETYSTSAITAELDRLAEADLPPATLGIAPFLYASQKARYRALGNKSPAAAQARGLAERVESRLGEIAHSVRFVSCVGRDTLSAAIERYAREGVTRITVATIAIGDGYITDQAKSAVDSIHPDAHGVEVRYAPPLWGSETISEHVADLVWRASGHQPETTGVALVVHGQPDAWRQSHPEFDVQENSFVNRVRLSLVERDIPAPNIRICFMEWQNPDVTETVRHLAALGCQRVLVCPACCPFENGGTRLDLQVSIRQARADRHIDTVILGAWGIGDTTSETLAETIRRTIRES